ncbi:hypothetical protein WMF04_22685 [Sorangium sp. So ce260]|uniref:hypothetical protein n=1 Tax=Sorangium sp. So ce260 TaxID=3133291 RepID=UPI003F6485AD
MKAPSVTPVEARVEDMLTGMGQCAAELVGARPFIFNQRAGNPIETVHGFETVDGCITRGGGTLE